MNLESRIHEASDRGKLSLKAAEDIAARFNISLIDVDRAALGQGIWPCRYSRHSSLLTLDEQMTLLDSTVAVAGCGGLGGHAASLLARLGIGRLILVDPDQFEESNLNRQLFCTVDTLCMNKAVAAAGALAKINPAVSAEPVEKGVEHSGHVFGMADVVMDCLDNVPSRRFLASMCRNNGTPLVHGAVSRTCGQLCVEVSGSAVLERLYPARCSGDTVRNDSVLSFSVAAVAAIQCSEVLKLLLGRPSVLQGTHVFFDIDQLEFEYGPSA